MVAPIIVYGIVSGVIIAIEAIKPRVKRWKERRRQWRMINSVEGLSAFPHKVDYSRAYSTDKLGESWAMVSRTTLIGAPEEEYEEINVVVPGEFICPISMEPMKDPVVLVQTKQTYDRDSIEKWLTSSNKCPCTGISLTDAPETSAGKGKGAVDTVEEASFLLEPNMELREAIRRWRESVPTPESLQGSELIM
mmetsp:Transcript_4485/g.16084  ORF Transcript_4485/g.16084 Transcript_4485/m.16084 type:complete len:193 (-) Transcript_4485:640-1218(-)